MRLISMLVPSSMMYLITNPTNWQDFALPLCVIFFMILILLGRIVIGERIEETGASPLLCLFLTLIWNTRRPEEKVSAEPIEPVKEPKESGVKPVSKSVQPVKKKNKKRKSAGKKNFESRLEEPKPRMCSTLQPYLKIISHQKYQGMDLYREFEKFLLTPAELSINDFPVECPDRPGHILTWVKTYHPSPTSRVCSRCSKTYQLVDGRYNSDTKCFYHSGRKNSNGVFSCCFRPDENPCKFSHKHVNPQLPFDDLVFKKVAKRQVREDQVRRVYALDCEMVFTHIGLEVAKVSMVDVEGKPVYSTFVLPEYPVLDFNTEFSGIRERDLQGVNITLSDVQAYLLKTLNKDTILVGHALQNDLKVLRIIHDKVVDTQVVFKGEGKGFRKKLKILAMDYLGRTIQESGHDSVEDARACMELMLHRIYNSMVDFPEDTFQILKKLQDYLDYLFPPPSSDEKLFPNRSLDLLYKLVEEAGLASALKELDAHLSLPEIGIESMRREKFQLVNEWFCEASEYSILQILYQIR